MNLPKSNSGLARLYMLLFLPLLPIAMMPMLNSLMTKSPITDMVVFFGYILMVIMLLVVVINERKKGVLTQELPYAALIVTFLLFVLIPVFALLAEPRIYAKYTLWLKSILMIIICLALPFLAFVKKLSTKAKVISILIAIVYAIFHFYPLAFSDARYYQLYRIFMRYFSDAKYLLIWLAVVYFALAYILNGLGFKNHGPEFFTSAAGFSLTYFGISHTVITDIGRVYENTVSSNRFSRTYTIETTFDINWLMLIGISIIIVSFITYLVADKKRKRVCVK